MPLHQCSDILRASGAAWRLTKCVLDVLTKLWLMLGWCMRWVLVTWGPVTCHTGGCQQGPGNHCCCCNWCELLLWRWATTAVATAARDPEQNRPATAEPEPGLLSALNQLEPNTRTGEPWAVLVSCPVDKKTNMCILVILKIAAGNVQNLTNARVEFLNWRIKMLVVCKARLFYTALWVC